MRSDASVTVAQLADAVTAHFGPKVHSVSRIARGTGTPNWLVRTAVADYFLKRFPKSANPTAEAAALRLSQAARSAGVPVPLVVPTVDGELLWSDGELTLALFEYIPSTTSGLPLSGSQMEQASQSLAQIHSCFGRRSGIRDIAATWLAFNAQRKRAMFQRYLATIDRRQYRGDFDRRTATLLHRRLELLPKAASLIRSLPPLTRQVIHGDYSVWNILFRESKLAGVVDFSPPELFLPAFEIGRAALNPETMTASPRWMDRALSFAAEYCRANPAIARSDVLFAPHVWAIQLVQSEYGLRQHYFGSLSQRAELDRFWVRRCETADLILNNLDDIGDGFAEAREQRSA